MQQLYTDTAEPGPADGVAGVVAAMLQSPQFIYRPEPSVDTGGTTATEPLEPYALATRLSFLLTGAGPDDALLAAAEAGALDSEDGLLAQDRSPAGGPARRRSCSCTSRSSGGSSATLPALDKDRSLYRTWTDATPARARRGDAPVPHRRLAGHPEPDDAADRAVHVRRRGPRVLLQPAGAGRQRASSASTLDPARAAGLLTQGSFLAEHAKANQTSPVLRGKFVRAQAVLHDRPRRRRPTSS